MNLAKEKFEQLMQKSDLIEKHKICVRILGNIELLPMELQVVLAKTVTSSQHHTNAVLNVCFAYTSRHEIFHAAKKLNDGVQAGLLLPSDINERLIEQCLYTHASAPLDLLIRTSGEVRLSDFLLWQVCFSLRFG